MITKIFQKYSLLPWYICGNLTDSAVCLQIQPELHYSNNEKQYDEVVNTINIGKALIFHRSFRQNPSQYYTAFLGLRVHQYILPVLSGDYHFKLWDGFHCTNISIQPYVFLSFMMVGLRLSVMVGLTFHINILGFSFIFRLGLLVFVKQKANDSILVNQLIFSFQLDCQ